MTLGGMNDAQPAYGTLHIGFMDVVGDHNVW